MQKNRTLTTGAVVSLFLHASLVYLVFAPAQKEAVPDARRMLVWLVPAPTPRPPPPPVPISQIPPETPVAATRAKRPAAVAPAITPPTPGAETGAIAVTAVTPVREAEKLAEKSVDMPPDPFAPATAPAPVKGKFDVNAAMKSARKLATAKSTKDDPAVAQIYDKPLYGLPGDTPLGTAVSRTARGDCKSVAQGTGILALIIVPVMILTDKKDSGCKW
jgi:hypothetical protein